MPTYHIETNEEPPSKPPRWVVASGQFSTMHAAEQSARCYCRPELDVCIIHEGTRHYKLLPRYQHQPETLPPTQIPIKFPGKKRSE